MGQENTAGANNEGAVCTSGPCGRSATKCVCPPPRDPGGGSRGVKVPLDDGFIAVGGRCPSLLPVVAFPQGGPQLQPWLGRGEGRIWGVPWGTCGPRHSALGRGGIRAGGPRLVPLRAPLEELYCGG
ncbi:unnamed protein product [Discosporangium mesarthrocarpum]